MKLEFNSASGHIFYLNHLISFFITCLSGFIFFYLLNKKKRDKAIHLFVSGLITYLLFHFCYLVNIWMWWSPIIVLIIGIGKEVVDLFNKKKQLFDFKDIVADLVGILTVSLIYLFSFVLVTK